MYASFPSAEATTSCGSGPVGAVPSTLSVAASTIASVLSPLLMARSRSAAAAGVAVRAQMQNARSRRALDLIFPLSLRLMVACGIARTLACLAANSTCIGGADAAVAWLCGFGVERDRQER